MEQKATFEKLTVKITKVIIAAEEVLSVNLPRDLRGETASSL